MDEILYEFILKRPEVIAAYGYGSGIIKQDGYNENDQKQLDLILIVNNLKEWHLKNMIINKDDYSLTGSLYYKIASNKALKGMTGITYMSNIKDFNNTFKIGTIEEKDFIKNLKSWNSFYLPGRFQKVVYPIKEDDNIKEVIEYNRKIALIISAALNNASIVSKKELFNTLCSLSYMGDTRMTFAENPNKIENIVNGSYNELNNIYDFEAPFFEEIDDDFIKMNKEYIDYYINYNDNMPSSLIHFLKEHKTNTTKQNIIKYLKRINKVESMQQTIKGIKTNGITKSIDYGAKKLSKRFKQQ